MKCEKCGAEIPSGASECSKCGSALDNPKTENASDINKSEQIPAEDKNKQSSAAEHEVSDADFEQRYTSMFESGHADEEAGYKIDEELKRRREARYDESFSNMTNEEKIQALEAARLARKEKRERKQAKKSGSILGSVLNEGKSSEGKAKDKPETEEEESSKTVKMNLSEIRSKLADRADRKEEKTEDKKSDEKQRAERPVRRTAERAKKSDRRPHKKIALAPRFGIIIGCVIAVVVIGIIIASVNMASKVAYEAPETPTVYSKGNSLYSHYDGKEAELSGNFIAEEYIEPEEPTASPRRTDDDDEAETTPAPVPDPIKEKELISYTPGGDVTYFIDNADMNTKSGSLKYIKSGKKRSLKSIADNAYYSIKFADDGSGVLYLTNADGFGEGGTLNYWSAASGSAVKVSDNVNADNFMFTPDGNGIVYISNYNSEYFVGDLYLSSITKGAVSESKKIESDVYKAFGTNPAGRTVVYAKNYNTETLCFELYMMKENASEPVRITDGTRCEPIIAKATDSMYAGGSYADYYQSLYYVSLESGQKEKIASGLTELVEMSKDEKAVVFRKANAEGTAFDYFYANCEGTDEQELAMNITVLDDPDHKRVCQFDINDDFTKAVYIQGYDLSSESGALFTVQINNGSVASDKKISDTAYSCNLTPDGNTVRFADNYDVTWNLVTLNAYTNDKNSVLASEVGAGAFTFDKAGEYIVYAKNYSLESKTGDVYCVDNKGKIVEVARGVSTYGLKNNGDIVYSLGGDDGNNLFFAAPNGKKSKSIDKDITKVVSY